MSGEKKIDSSLQMRPKLPEAVLPRMFILKSAP